MANAILDNSSSPSSVEESSSISREQVAKRAYEKWQQRGCPLWDGEEDWFTAQLELEREALNCLREFPFENPEHVLS